MFELTDEQIAQLESAKKAIFAALKRGEELCFLDGPRFHCAEFHTEICYVRKMINRENLPYVLVSRRAEFAPKRYCCFYSLQDIPEDKINPPTEQLCLPLS